MSSLLRVALLLTLGLVVLWRGLVYLNDRLADAQRPVYPMAAASSGAPGEAPAAAAAPAGPAAPPVLPPPTDEQLHALAVTRGDALVFTLDTLRRHRVTPALLEALTGTAAREPYPGILQRIACLRARADEAPLSVAFDALPTDRHDVDWNHDGVQCLVAVIASRAEEDPARATEVLADRALDHPAPLVLEALRRLDPPELPSVMAEAIAARDRRRPRLNAVKAAIAIGAAAKWPDQVEAWLRDEALYGYVRQGLAERTDEASMGFLAREITANPGDQNLVALAERFSRTPGTLDLELAAIAADPQAASFARGHAAHLVGLYGGEAASRQLAAIKADDPTVVSALAAAGADIDQRFGPNLRAGAAK